MPPRAKAVKGKHPTTPAREATRSRSRKRGLERKEARSKAQQAAHLENVRSGVTRWQLAQAARAERRKGLAQAWRMKHKSEQLPAVGS